MTFGVQRSRPLVLVDAAIHDEPFAALDQVAEVLRYGDEREFHRLVADRGPEVVGLGVLLTTEVDEHLLGQLPSLRIVASYSVGVDNVDLAAVQARGVIVTNTPDVLTEATADLTWALILAVARRMREGEAAVRERLWRDWHPRFLLGLELSGATLAILGLGRIGAAVARRALGFGMRLVYWSRSAKPDLERALGIRRLELDAALATADVVSIHLPLTAETHHLIDADRLARFKPGAILVNTARGPIVDEAALADALERGHLAGAGLDVYEEEPRIHPRLLAHPRTVLLPHLGSATVAARTAMARLVAENLRAVLEGRPPLTPVALQTKL
jgi:glyoxylate reductase